jgi:hypothetical protein
VSRSVTPEAGVGEGARESIEKDPRPEAIRRVGNDLHVAVPIDNAKTVLTLMISQERGGALLQCQRDDAITVQAELRRKVI